jgi:hypothetical protein
MRGQRPESDLEDSIVPEDSPRPVRGYLLKADAGNRTPDLLITSEPLCHLSYVGMMSQASWRFAPLHPRGALV